jgi:GntR family transcriptional regulator
MSIGIRIDPRDAVPIWKQIEDGVRRLAAGGALRPTMALPSVRDLARELRVNPATVSKAYQRLTECGLLGVRRGKGTFLSDKPPTLTRAERTQELNDAAVRFAGLAATLGASLEESVARVEQAWPRKGRGGE